MDKTRSEDLELAEDLLAGEEEERDVWFEQPEPSVPSIYEDCQHPYIPVGYTARPAGTRVVVLSRDQYDYAAACLRFEEMTQERGWTVFGDGWGTARYWCWRVLDE